MEYRAFAKYYSELTTVLSDKNYLHHFVTAGIIPPEKVHHLSTLSDNDRAIRVLKNISDPLMHSRNESFYNMLKIMREHGNLHAKGLAKSLKKASVSGVEPVGNTTRSIANARSDSIGSITRSDSARSSSVRSDSFRSDSFRSDSVRSGSIVSATSIGEGTIKFSFSYYLTYIAAWLFCMYICILSCTFMVVL